jgi:hypothetical protein
VESARDAADTRIVQQGFTRMSVAATPGVIKISEAFIAVPYMPKEL